LPRACEAAVHLMRIGLDLDNTLIDYAPALPVVAESLGLEGSTDRASLRATLRSTDDEAWQYLQSRLYTDGLEFAVPTEGSVMFLQEAVERGASVMIVSHKTATTPERFGGRPLHAPALAWLEHHGIAPALVRSEDVWFCATREEKIAAIRAASLDWFVDDLLEVLHHPLFPASTTGLWFAPHRDRDRTRGRAQGGPESVDFTELQRRVRIACP
jgi:hypothetical protein